jgi:hypothetical protein
MAEFFKMSMSALRTSQTNSSKSIIKEDPTPSRIKSSSELTVEVAHYIAQMTGEMSGMARSANLELLGYFLEMARIEATTILHQIEQ